MASNWPTSVDNFGHVTGTESTNHPNDAGLTHAAVHNLLADAVTTLETRLQTIASGTNQDATPSGSGEAYASIVIAASNSVNKNADYVCTGVADQNIINTAISTLSSSGGEVIFLAGTYNTTGSIIVNSPNITLKGEQVQAVSIYGASTNTSADDYDLIKVTGFNTNTVIIDSFNLYSSASSQRANNDIGMVHFIGATFSNYVNNCIFNLQGSAYSRTIYGSWPYAVLGTKDLLLGSWFGVSDSTVTNNWIFNTGGIRLINSNGGDYIYNNNLLETVTGIEQGGGTSFISSNNVEITSASGGVGSITSTMWSPGIACVHGFGHIYHNNIVYNNPAPCMYLVQAREITIIGNYFDPEQGAGAADTLDLPGSVAVAIRGASNRISDINVTDNLLGISSSGGVSIQAGSSMDWLVGAHVTFNSPTLSAFAAGKFTNISITNNKISYVQPDTGTGYGINIVGDNISTVADIKVSNNTIYDTYNSDNSWGTGIRLSTGVNHCDINNNMIRYDTPAGTEQAIIIATSDCHDNFVHDNDCYKTLIVDNGTGTVQSNNRVAKDWYQFGSAAGPNLISGPLANLYRAVTSSTVTNNLIYGWNSSISSYNTGDTFNGNSLFGAYSSITGIGSAADAQVTATYNSLFGGSTIQVYGEATPGYGLTCNYNALMGSNPWVLVGPRGGSSLGTYDVTSTLVSYNTLIGYSPEIFTYGYNGTNSYNNYTGLSIQNNILLGNNPSVSIGLSSNTTSAIGNYNNIQVNGNILISEYGIVAQQQDDLITYNYLYGYGSAILTGTNGSNDTQGTNAATRNYLFTSTGTISLQNGGQVADNYMLGDWPTLSVTGTNSVVENCILIGNTPSITWNNGTILQYGYVFGEGTATASHAMSIGHDHNQHGPNANVQDLIAIGTTTNAIAFGVDATPSGFGGWGGGSGMMMYLHNAGATPNSNPTSGGYMFSTGGALYWRGSSGTVTKIASA